MALYTGEIKDEEGVFEFKIYEPQLSYLKQLGGGCIRRGIITAADITRQPDSGGHAACSEVDKFLTNYYEVTDNSNDTVELKELYDDFLLEDFADIGKIQFSKALQKRGAVKVKGFRNKTCITNIRRRG